MRLIKNEYYRVRNRARVGIGIRLRLGVVFSTRILNQSWFLLLDDLLTDHKFTVYHPLKMSDVADS